MSICSSSIECHAARPLRSQAQKEAPRDLPVVPLLVVEVLSRTTWASRQQGPPMSSFHSSGLPAMRGSIIAMSQGDSVVAIVDPAYTEAGSLPTCSRQPVSPLRQLNGP